MNYLLLQSLERFNHFYGDSLKVSIPCGKSWLLGLKMVVLFSDFASAEGGCAPMNLAQSGDLLRDRLVSLFVPNPEAPHGGRPIHGDSEKYANDPHWKDLVLFYEYFDGCKKG